VDKVSILKLIEVVARVFYGVFLIIPFFTALSTLPPTSFRHFIYLFFCFSYAFIILFPMRTKSDYGLSFILFYRILMPTSMLSGFLALGWWLCSTTNIAHSDSGFYNNISYATKGWLYYLCKFSAEGIGCIIIWFAPAVIFVLSNFRLKIAEKKLDSIEIYSGES
jgi:hypothetical protein